MTGKLLFAKQRITALFQLGFLLYVTFVLTVHHNLLSYSFWSEFIRKEPMRIFSTLFVLSVVVHSLVGLWVVVTDYIKPAWLKKIVLLSVGFVYIYSLFQAISCFWR